MIHSIECSTLYGIGSAVQLLIWMASKLNKYMLQFLFLGLKEAQKQMNFLHLTYFLGLIMRRIDEGELVGKQIIQRKHVM